MVDSSYIPHIFNSFIQADQNLFLCNSVIPMRRLVMSGLIRVYTVCHSDFDFRLKPYNHKHYDETKQRVQMI